MPGVPGLMVALDDPARADVRDLLRAHRAFSRGQTPEEFSFALDVEAFADPAVRLFSARSDGELLGVGALRHLDRSAVEIKSMHTRMDVRGRGIGRAIVERLLDVAASDGYDEVLLETGTMEAFAPAIALYHSLGFRPCEPFGDYRPSPYNQFMRLALTGPAVDGGDRTP